MSWKRIIANSLMGVVANLTYSEEIKQENTQSIFILRNNDLGDLLIITPLFEVLRRLFPNTYIVAGVGSWNVETLKLNPYISEILPINAPWHNKFVSQQSLPDALKYIAFSSESQELAKRRFDVGIDVLGSYFGSLLMMRAGIPYRLGVRGYGGGHTAVQRYVEFNEYEQVGRSALRFAEILGATDLPECKPQIFLSAAELELGERRWRSRSEENKRIVLGPGGGFPEKCWPLENYIELVKMLNAIANLEVMIVGGKQDWQAGQQLASYSQGVQNFAGELTLRETFALVANADFVICNSSMLMHVAAAFSIPTVVLLGEYFNSTKQHQAQWGYEEICHIFGKESDRQEIYRPTEVREIIGNLLNV